MNHAVRIFTVFYLALLFSVPANAQQTFAGVREGVGFWLTKNGRGKGSLKYAPGNHFTWNKEFFIRRHGSGKWAYEFDLVHYQHRYKRVDRGDSIGTYENWHSNFLELNFVLQYDVTYPLAAFMFPVLSKMKSYIGFSAAPRAGFHKVEPVEAGMPKGWIRSSSLDFFIGMHYTHFVPITDRLVLSSCLSFRMKPFDRMGRADGDFYEPNRQISLSSGVCYRL